MQTIGETLEEFHQDINTEWINRDRSKMTPDDVDLIFEQESRERIQQETTRKLTKAEIDFMAKVNDVRIRHDIICSGREGF